MLRKNLIAGAAIAAMMAAAPATADEVVLDDLIVAGNECVGVDCVENMDFGFCTEILQENNLRIFFNDSSTFSMFPKNDWEIVANDTFDGGASYLGFADRGAGLVSTCGEGLCEGGDNEGAPCTPGSGCEGVCVDAGVLDGFPCLDDSLCQIFEPTGTCEGEGTCVATGAIIFRIEAGGPEDSLLIDSAGDVNVAGNLNVGGAINGGTSGVAQRCPAKQFVIGIEADGTIICAKKNHGEDGDSDSDSDSG